MKNTIRYLVAVVLVAHGAQVMAAGAAADSPARTPTPAHRQDSGATPSASKPGDAETHKVVPVTKMPSEALLPGKPMVSYVVVSPARRQSGDLSTKNGCWAKLYDEDSLHGDELTLLGPIDIPNTEEGRVFGIDWKDRISNIDAGPKAQVLVYDNRNFKDLVARIMPGKTLNPNKDMNYFREIKSLRVLCAK